METLHYPAEAGQPQSAEVAEETYDLSNVLSRSVSEESIGFSHSTNFPVAFELDEAARNCGTESYISDSDASSWLSDGIEDQPSESDSGDSEEPDLSITALPPFEDHNCDLESQRRIPRKATPNAISNHSSEMPRSELRHSTSRPVRSGSNVQRSSSVRSHKDPDLVSYLFDVSIRAQAYGKGDMGWSRRSEESSQLAATSKMDLYAFGIVFYLHFASCFHHGSSSAGHDCRRF